MKYIAEFEKWWDKLEKQNSELQAKCDELEKKLKIAKEALEKYANQARWESIDINCEKFYCAHSGSQFAYDALKDIE